MEVRDEEKMDESSPYVSFFLISLSEIVIN